MKTARPRITPFCFSVLVILLLCLLPLAGCESEDVFTVTITRPDKDSRVFTEGDPILFEASISYTLYGKPTPMPNFRISWTSDIDGTLLAEAISMYDNDTSKTTHSFTTSALSPGTHTITCTIYFPMPMVDVIRAQDSIELMIKEAPETATTTTTTADGGSGDLDVATCCEALDYLEVRSKIRYQSEIECGANIIIKNNSTVAIYAGLYVDDSDITSTNPNDFNRDGWGFRWLEPGDELEVTTMPEGWGWKKKTDGTMWTVITSQATAIYYDANTEYGDRCLWIVDTLFTDDPAEIRTRDVSGLNPCE